MIAVERIAGHLAGETAWVGLAVGGWLAALLIAMVAVWQAGRADRVCVRAAETAHELRGPLCAARLALASLQRVLPDAPRLATGLASIDLELVRAGLALDDLGRLDATADATARSASRSSSGLVDLKALAAAAEPAWRALAAASDKTLELHMSGGPALAAGDSRRLHQGIGNLVANACEHGCGPVRVTIEGDGQGARVEVADGGPGPSAQSLEHARRRARRRWMTGTPASRRGHGLAVVARVARGSGGRLDTRVTLDGAVVTLALSADPLAATLRQRLDGMRRRDRRARRASAEVSAVGIRSRLPSVR